MKKIYLIRHGQTDWNVTGQHTSTTDLPLNEEGKHQATSLGKTVQKIHFEHVFSSPMQRAIETCMKSGLGSKMKILEDLSEWDYGRYEGRTTSDIRKEVPNWTIFDFGAKEGETIAMVEYRAKRLIEKLQELEGNIALFSHGHFSRVIAAVWIGLGSRDGKHFVSSNASVSILGYEKEAQVILAWNDTSHFDK